MTISLTIWGKEQMWLMRSIKHCDKYILFSSISVIFNCPYRDNGRITVKALCNEVPFEPRHKSTHLLDLWQGKTQTGLLSYRDQLEVWNFRFRKYSYYTIQAANNKGADQTARMRRLICAFVVCIRHKQVFSWNGSFKWSVIKFVNSFFNGIQPQKSMTRITESRICS